MQNFQEALERKQWIDTHLSIDIVMRIIDEHITEIHKLRKEKPGSASQYIRIIYQSTGTLRRRIQRNMSEKSVGVEAGQIDKEILKSC